MESAVKVFSPRQIHRRDLYLFFKKKKSFLKYFKNIMSSSARYYKNAALTKVTSKKETFSRSSSLSVAAAAFFICWAADDVIDTIHASLALVNVIQWSTMLRILLHKRKLLIARASVQIQLNRARSCWAHQARQFVLTWSSESWIIFASRFSAELSVSWPTHVNTWIPRLLNL